MFLFGIFDLLAEPDSRARGDVRPIDAASIPLRSLMCE
jgi:hypothetical protein